MGKKRKFSRFIRWIKSDLPDENKSVLLLGVTKIPSPTPSRARPHTLYLDHNLTGKSQTLDNQLRPKSQIFRSHSKDSLNELLTAKIKDINSSNYCKSSPISKFIKKVSFDTEKSTKGCVFKKRGENSDKKLGFCIEQPYEFYHPANNSKFVEETKANDVEISDFMMDKSVDSIGSCSLDVDASSTDFSDSSVGSSDCTLRSLGIPSPTSDQKNNIPRLQIDQKSITALIEPKKPSYLNLACSVNGYSNITNYDSKLRENFRNLPKSREVSPIRPQDIHNYNGREKFKDENKFLTPNYFNNCNNKKMQEINNKMSSTTTTSYSSNFISRETKKIVITSGIDTTDNHKINGSQIETTKISSNYYLNGKESFLNIQSNGKSFIQQRVERLYGPGALAQGFFISKRNKNRSSESSENGEIITNGSYIHHESLESKEKDSSFIKQSTSVPSLPVLRHLRPEFRAQLPILSPKRSNPTENIIQKSSTVPASLATTTPKVIENHQIEVSKPEKKVVNGTGVKDGHYFLMILKNETDRLIGLAEKVEADLEEKKSELNDEVLGYLRSASGKARLLVTQKMQQFAGLCHKNINQIEGEQFPTTPEDLQGFWDMVMLQVTQVDELFAEIDRIRNNNWTIQEKQKPEQNSADQKSKKLVIIKKPLSANAEAQRKQREAARKKMLEDRRKAMRNKQQAQPENESIEIFIPENTS